MNNFCSHCGKPIVTNAEFCTHCGASLTGKKPARKEWQDKREKVLRQGNPRPKRWMKSATIAALFVAAFIWVYVNLPEGGNPIVRAQPVVAEPVKYSNAGQQMFDIPATIENGKIIVPLDLVKEKKFIAFNYESPDKTVPMLAYITTDGKIVTAVSMCEPCNSKRFHLSGEELVCNACGSTWKLKNLEALTGGCSKYPPDAVPNVVVGNQIQIDVQQVAQWQRRI
ncbi:MAG: Fe-S-containing protein [bacterium]